MAAVKAPGRDILAKQNRAKRDQIVKLLTKGYWMEIETVINYLACSTNPDGVRAQEVMQSLRQDIPQELSHAQQFANRIKELYGVVPGSMAFTPQQTYLQPPSVQTDVVSVIKGVIEAEQQAIDHYTRVIEATDGVDWVTQELIINVLKEEQAHLRLFEGFLREYEAGGLA